MGNSPEAELKKMSQELSVFGGSERGFEEIYRQSKQEPFDFCFLNIQDMTARRNFEPEPIWSQHDKKKDSNDDDEVDKSDLKSELDKNKKPKKEKII